MTLRIQAAVLLVLALSLVSVAGCTTGTVIEGLEETQTFGGDFKGVRLTGLSAQITADGVVIRGRMEYSGTATLRDVGLKVALEDKDGNVGSVSEETPVTTVLRRGDSVAFEVTTRKPKTGTWYPTFWIFGRVLQ